MVNRWVTNIGLDKSQCDTHSLRRTKASLIYAKTKKLRAIQLLLGHAKLESTIEYLCVEIEDIEPNEKFECPSCGVMLRYVINEGTYYGAQHMSVEVIDE
jgi:hypothetical protein